MHEVPKILRYPVRFEQETDLKNRFTYHAPLADQPRRYGFLRERAHRLALSILEFTPPSREQSLALTKLEEALMWANAAIARNEKAEEPRAVEPVQQEADDAAQS